MPKIVGKNYSWFAALRFPILFGSLLIVGGYMTLNFKTLFSGLIEDRKQRERDYEKAMYENKPRNKDK